MTNRTDPHSPGAFNPDDYSYLVSFSLATEIDGWPVPPVNIDRTIELRKQYRFANIHGGLNVCDVCGAHFKSGDCWLHEPTQTVITLGHTCADKYQLQADREDWRKLRGQALNRARRLEERRSVRAAIRAQLEDDAELRAALKVDNPTTRDIRDRFVQFGTVSPAQARLLKQIAARESEPKAEAPNGRVEVEAEIVTVKQRKNPYSPNPTWKAVVKVTESDGSSWRAWGTVPDALLGQVWLTGGAPALVGRRVRFAAKFQRSADDPSFAFYSRPTKSALLPAA